jgi:hypothetical protein
VPPGRAGSTAGGPIPAPLGCSAGHGFPIFGHANSRAGPASLAPRGRLVAPLHPPLPPATRFPTRLDASRTTQAPHRLPPPGEGSAAAAPRGAADRRSRDTAHVGGGWPARARHVAGGGVLEPATSSATVRRLAVVAVLITSTATLHAQEEEGGSLLGGLRRLDRFLSNPVEVRQGWVQERWDATVGALLGPGAENASAVGRSLTNYHRTSYELIGEAYSSESPEKADEAWRWMTVEGRGQLDRARARRADGGAHAGGTGRGEHAARRPARRVRGSRLRGGQGPRRRFSSSPSR